MGYDRMTATDRAVSAFTRFSETPYQETPEEMLVGLCEWYQCFIDRDVTDDKLLDLFARAMDRFRNPEPVPEEVSRRPRRMSMLVDTGPPPGMAVHDEVVYEPRSAVPLPEHPHGITDADLIERGILQEIEEEEEIPW